MGGAGLLSVVLRGTEEGVGEGAEAFVDMAMSSQELIHRRISIVNVLF